MSFPIRLDFLESQDDVCLVPHSVSNSGLAHSRSSRNMCWMEGGREEGREGRMKGWRDRGSEGEKEG